MTDLRYRLGIDGGGTGCRSRLTDLHGHALGEGEGGPANLALGLDAALASILQATRDALARAGLDDTALAHTAAGFGLAAANVPRLRDAFERLPLPFASATVRSDAEAACLGAHGGGDGGILILGTGSQGVVHAQGRFATLGGWGFALSDTGSGAALGRAAVRRALLAHEDIEPPSPLTMALMARLGNDPASMVDWAAGARPRDWAEFARDVFDHAARHDPVAIELVRQSARDVDRLIDRLRDMGATRISLMGGVAQPTRPYLSTRHDGVLALPQGDALAGALLLAASKT